MSRDPSDKALDSTNSLKHRIISVDRLNCENALKLYVSVITY